MRIVALILRRTDKELLSMVLMVETLNTTV